MSSINIPGKVPGADRTVWCADQIGHFKLFVTFAGGIVVSQRYDIVFLMGGIHVDLSDPLTLDSIKPFPILWLNMILDREFSSDRRILVPTAIVNEIDLGANPFLGFPAGKHGTVDADLIHIGVGAGIDEGAFPDGEYGTEMNFTITIVP